MRLAAVLSRSIESRDRSPRHPDRYELSLNSAELDERVSRTTVIIPMIFDEIA